MSDTVGDFVIDRLIEWDLHRFYGLPGDGTGGFDGAVGRAESDGKDFRYIRPTHEEIAAFMARAHAKFTGEVGVCIATSGPGVIHLLNALYDAKTDSQPVVAIVGQQGLVSLGSDTQQQVDLERGAAIPYAVAAKFAHPDRLVVCTTGDDAFQMLGMNELLTVKRHWHEWQVPRFIVLVLHNNNDPTQAWWEIREVGDPRYDTSQLVEDMDYTGFAELLGLRAITVDQRDQVAAAGDAAFAPTAPASWPCIPTPTGRPCLPTSPLTRRKVSWSRCARATRPSPRSSSTPCGLSGSNCSPTPRTPCPATGPEPGIDEGRTWC